MFDTYLCLIRLCYWDNLFQKEHLAWIALLKMKNKDNRINTAQKLVFFLKDFLTNIVFTNIE